MNGQWNMCVIYRHSEETKNNLSAPPVPHTPTSIFCLYVLEQKRVR